NLEAKLELCTRAEKLAEVELIKDAIQELNELHHEFKHLGPVPKEDKEAVWQRFKAASDAVYAKRDAYLQNLQQELQKRWEVIGGLPRAKAKEVNKKFWSAFKTFFNNKNAFFKKLDEEREQN